MECLMGNRYTISNHTPENLEKLGFYCRGTKDGTKYYTYMFPVYKYKDRLVLQCTLTLNMVCGTIGIDVYDVSHHCEYRPFYRNEYGNYECLLRKINAIIWKEFRKLGIVENKEICSHGTVHHAAHSKEWNRNNIERE